MSKRLDEFLGFPQGTTFAEDSAAMDGIFDRYNVGDKVRVDIRGYAVHTTIGGYDPASHSMGMGTVTKKLGGGKYEVTLKSGDIIKIDEADILGKIY